MTTIAYKDGVIAYDSRTTTGLLVNSDTTNKRHVVDGVSFFIAGAICDQARLITAYFGTDVGTHVGCRALAVDAGVVYECAVADDDGFWRHPLEPGEPMAIGSGAHFAFGAMDAGASAAEAVKIASDGRVYFISTSGPAVFSGTLDLLEPEDRRWVRVL